MLTRTYRVSGKRKLLEETMESRNPHRVNLVYDKWWSDPQTVKIELVERKMDSVELVRHDSR